MYIHPHSSTSLLLYMLTSCSGVGAVLWDFTIALALHTCVYLYIFALWRRCSPAGFHQSSCTDESACSLLPNECLRMVFWPCSMFLWCMTSFCDYGHCVHNTFVSLTEGRSARTYPSSNQQKKKSKWPVLLSSCLTAFFSQGTILLFMRTCVLQLTDHIT